MSLIETSRFDGLFGDMIQETWQFDLKSGADAFGANCFSETRALSDAQPRFDPAELVFIADGKIAVEMPLADWAREVAQTKAPSGVAEEMAYRSIIERAKASLASGGTRFGMGLFWRCWRIKTK